MATLWRCTPVLVALPDTWAYRGPGGVLIALADKRDTRATVWRQEGPSDPWVFVRHEEVIPIFRNQREWLAHQRGEPAPQPNLPPWQREAMQRAKQDREPHQLPTSDRSETGMQPHRHRRNPRLP